MFVVTGATSTSIWLVAELLTLAGNDSSLAGLAAGASSLVLHASHGALTSVSDRGDLSPERRRVVPANRERRRSSWPRHDANDAIVGDVSSERREREGKKREK